MPQRKEEEEKNATSNQSTPRTPYTKPRMPRLPPNQPDRSMNSRPPVRTIGSGNAEKKVRSEKRVGFSLCALRNIALLNAGKKMERENRREKTNAVKKI
ncbi:hypothetical protein BTUL_0162g00020 [Botrytis tulipae]|uniref:Uncharacterized protein n=1 Tax=Botrytis tulipae TaxID=87230 RepID=A0A4Z1EBC5_9HELO|nr:hypothetical protein BTUL_0162g00020 [Botrytis tulipae]